jgi:CHAD domain-containing protein
MKRGNREILAGSIENINKYLKKSGKGFHASDIHSFRIEVKKLQAFVQITSFENTYIRMRGRLKKFYKLLGRIRFIQLLQETIPDASHACNIPLPKKYLSGLSSDKKKLKKMAGDRIRIMKFFKVSDFSRDLPDKMQMNSTRIYFATKKNALNGLLKIGNPDELQWHEARKIAKEIVSNCLLFKTNRNRMQGFTKNVIKILRSLESGIGCFHDISLSLRFLEKEIRNPQLDMSEQGILKDINNQWQKEKENWRKKMELLVTRYFELRDRVRGLRLFVKDSRAEVKF